MRRYVTKAVVAAAALALVVGVTAGCGSSSKKTSTSSGATTASIPTSGGKKGGVYKVAWEQSFGFTDNFDPTGEYLGEAFAILSSLTTRTLVGYNHVPGGPGNTLVPDLATDVPQPTDGGLTYTFTLKDGIKFGPPVSRAITSKDVLYAMERLANPKDGAEYAFYYTVIKGWDAYASGKAKTISGIETPDNKTIVFHLTQPTGDFLYRMAMPATGPIPEEVAKCFEGKPGNYGRDLVSTGPYMMQGADKVNMSSCSTIKPMSGYDPLHKMILVRNPDYDPSTDSKAAREALPDEFDFTIDANVDDIYNKVKAGQLDDEVAGETPKVLAEYTTTPSLKPMLHQFLGDRTWYLTMNLTQPPFDDIHIRKAMNYIMDKVSLRKAWGGPAAGAIAHHIVPDSMFSDQLKNYDPYGTANDAGDLAKAKAEVKLSKYSNQDGVCTASACKNVLMISDTINQYTRMVPVIEADAKKIGITFTVRTINGAYPVIQTPSKNIPIADRPGWGKDYADALTFFQALFTSGAIIPQGNTNYSLVGITPAIAAKVGAKGTLTGIPSIDPMYNKCAVIPVGQKRLTCWENLDKYLMENVVPWVPYLWSYATDVTGPGVTQWNFDQFAGSIGYAHVAVK